MTFLLYIQSYLNVLLNLAQDNLDRIVKLGAERPSTLIVIGVATAIIIGILIGRALRADSSHSQLPDPTWWQRFKGAVWQVVGTLLAAAALTMAESLGWLEFISVIVISTMQAGGF